MGESGLGIVRSLHIDFRYCFGVARDGSWLIETTENKHSHTSVSLI